MLKKFFLIVILLSAAVSCSENSTIEQPENEQQNLSDDDISALVEESSDEDILTVDNSVVDEDLVTEEVSVDNDIEADEAEEDATPDDDAAIEEESTVDGVVEDKSVFLEGNNDCYMIQAYFPKESLLEFLPGDLALPEDVDMRKYHPEMEYGEPDEFSKWWSIEDILDASFEQVGEELEENPQFFNQILSAPFVTMSYPQPLVTMVFYQSKVYEEKIRKSEASLWGNYNDSDIYDSDDTVSIYSKYFFTMSQPMDRNKFYDN